MIQSSELILNPDGSALEFKKTGTYCSQHHLCEIKIVLKKSQF
jgi:hypothetical protein